MTAEELDVRRAGVGNVAHREREHLLGHVEADRSAVRADSPGRQEDVDPAAGAEIEDALTFMELGDGDRVATAERGKDRGVRQSERSSAE